MSDLVERLRKTAKMLMPHYPMDICTQAADRIEALEARNSSLVEQCDTHAQQKMAAKNRIEALEAQAARIKTELTWMEERGRNSTSYGSHADAYEVAARHLRLALDVITAPEQDK